MRRLSIIAALLMGLAASQLAGPRLATPTLTASQSRSTALASPVSHILAAPAAARRVAHGVFFEGFQGPAGAPPNPSVWSFDTGPDWGEGAELEDYTSKPRNASLDGHGDLLITARRETTRSATGQAFHYTSARLQTWRKLDFTYGQIAARIKVPRGHGLWPAFWALGEEAYAKDNWPNSGEIDVMEMLGAHPHVAYGTVHGPSPRSSEGYALQGAYRSRSPLSSGFHTYSADWGPGSVTFAVDGHPYKTVRRADLPPQAGWPFDHPFFLILDLAVGGRWGGDPTSTTRWPAQMLVRWVRVGPACPSVLRSASSPRARDRRARSRRASGRWAAHAAHTQGHALSGAASCR